MKIKSNKFFILILLFTAIVKLYAQPNVNNHIVDAAYIDTMIEHEKFFSANDTVHAPAGVKWFRITNGSVNRIMFIAPHTTSQTREGKLKAADAGTGSLIEALNNLRDVPVLYTTYLSPSDPNYYDNNEFKDSLNEFLNDVKPMLVIDLHASDYSRPYDIDFGTMHGASLLDMGRWLDTLTRELQTSGITNLSSNFFPAEKNETDTKFTSKHGYACLQLEINAKYLSPSRGKSYAARTHALLQALARFIDEIQR